MNLREVKMLAAGIVAISLVTTNFVIPSITADIAPANVPLRVTAISKPEPIEPQIKADTIPEPVRVLSPAEANAKGAERRAHAERILAENGELTTAEMPTTRDDAQPSALKCVAGCD